MLLLLSTTVAPRSSRVLDQIAVAKTKNLGKDQLNNDTVVNPFVNLQDRGV